MYIPCLELPAGTRLLAVLTFGNRMGWLNEPIGVFVVDVVDVAGSSILISCFKNGELMPIGIEAVAVFVEVVATPSFASFFWANVAAVWRSFPPPLGFNNN